MLEGGRAARHAYNRFEAPGAVSVSELLSAFGCTRLDESTARRITGSLAYSGIRCRPSLFEVLARRGIRAERAARGVRYDAPGIVAGGAQLQGEEVIVSETPAFAVQGGLIAALVVVSICYYRWWPYGLVALIATFVGIGGLVFTFPSASERLPAGFPRGRTLGSSITATVGTLAVVLFAALR